MTKRTVRAPRHAERGAATVEFFLVMPAVLGLIGLVIGAGWLGAAWAIVDHGAREGAREAALWEGRGWPDRDAVTQAVEAATPLVSPTSVDVVGDEAKNAPVRVNVSYEVQNPVRVLFVPLEFMVGTNPVPQSFTVSSSEEVRRE